MDSMDINIQVSSSTKSNGSIHKGKQNAFSCTSQQAIYYKSKSFNEFDEWLLEAKQMNARAFRNNPIDVLLSMPCTWTRWKEIRKLMPHTTLQYKWTKQFKGNYEMFEVMFRNKSIPRNT